MILLLLLTFLIILLLELPKMLVQKQLKELTVFLGLWSAALLVALLQTLHIPIPSPIVPIMKLLQTFIPQ